MNLDDTTKVTDFRIWDTSGEERFRAIMPMYYRDARAAILVYDITKAETFDNVKFWVRELKNNAPDDILIVLVGNKFDLDLNRIVKQSIASKYAEDNGLIYLETSAKSAYNVDEIFFTIAHRLPKAQEKRLNGSTVNLNQEETNTYQKKCC